ncbi:DUF2281 domain-containing protein [Hymenobacter weizhouensis]|uniref:DUF2281 domain-containing protein n=1 Tax=Hymenobacter sp. YIM 151500-1 TaxID=2987689 RepID=UPI002226416E|nr:DUF2281 domain-containing protein [Hymenobacter sp. YIM 151500-1]UYZ62560.1 DUF2281 domain-containing protein [Hymenobacter sp. YIM 151500-1]
MSKQEIIDQTVQLLEQLPEEKAAEILDFAAFLMQRSRPNSIVITEPLEQVSVPLLKRRRPSPSTSETDDEEDDKLLTQQIAAYVENSPVFAFLHDPAEDIYTLDDLKVRYQ